MISIFSWQCDYSMKRQRFYRFVRFAQNTDIHLNGKTVKLHDWPKMGSQFLVQWTTSYFLSYQDCHHIPAAVCLQRRDQRISPIILEKWEHHQIQWRVSDKHACGKPMLTDPDKQATGNREPANEINKEDPTQGIPTWLQPITENLEDLETHMRSHIPLKERTQIRKVMLQRWRQKRKHSVHAYFRKTKNICSASGKVWWLDDSRAQSPQRKKWISEQSPIRCRGTSSRRSMESVSNQNFTGDGK